MLGIVFTEFLEMVEKKFGYETVDHLLENTDLASNGVYTAIGTYDHSEIVALVVGLHRKTEIPVPDLLQAFGQYLHGTFANNYSAFFDASPNAFQFLESIEHYIHVEVKKLYPNAQLPSFESERPDDQSMVLLYSSERSMGSFALGLIEKTFEYYKEEADITMENLEEDGSRVKFTLIKK